MNLENQQQPPQLLGPPQQGGMVIPQVNLQHQMQAPRPGGMPGQINMGHGQMAQVHKQMESSYKDRDFQLGRQA